MLELLEYTDVRWKEFVNGHSKAIIFHSPEWSKLLRETYQFRPFALVQLDPSGKVTAGIPIVKRKLRGKTSWVSLPFTDHCPFLFKDNQEEETFAQSLNGFILQRTHSSFELRWPYPLSNGLLSKNSFVIHKLALDEDFEVNHKLIHPSSKRNARTAQKHNVRIEIHNDMGHINEFYRLHLLTRHKQGVPIQPYKFFQHLQNLILSNGMGFVMSAYDGEKCLAAAVFLTWNKSIIYKYGASDPGGLQLRPNDLIFQEVIKWGCEHGYKSLDFGRTDMVNSGLRHFKSRWGSEETELVYSYAPVIPSGIPTKYMNLLGKIIKISPLWVCRLFGEILYRYV
jgi:CelD/BcsL family acetyltransferase involved in cellulose biosynthesis